MCSAEHAHPPKAPESFPSQLHSTPVVYESCTMSGVTTRMCAKLRAKINPLSCHAIVYLMLLNYAIKAPCFTTAIAQGPRLTKARSINIVVDRPLNGFPLLVVSMMRTMYIAHIYMVRRARESVSCAELGGCVSLRRLSHAVHIRSIWYSSRDWGTH